MSLLEVWCEGSFQGSREEDDILRSRRMKSLSLGMPPWFIPAYFKKTQASKLGDAQGIPFFIDNTIRSLLVKLYFYSVTFLCSLLGASVCFCFYFVLNKVGSCHSYIGDITLLFFLWNTCVLNYALNVHGEVLLLR